MAWAKGESGNPGGRPSAVRPIQDLARTHSEAAFLRIVELAQGGDDAKIILAACKEIIDRAFGKPVQVNELTEQQPARVVINFTKGATRKSKRDKKKAESGAA